MSIMTADSHWILLKLLCHTIETKAVVAAEIGKKIVSVNNLKLSNNSATIQYLNGSSFECWTAFLWLITSQGVCVFVCVFVYVCSTPWKWWWGCWGEHVPLMWGFHSGSLQIDANTSKTQRLSFGWKKQIHRSAEALSPWFWPKIGTVVARLLNPGCRPCAHEKGPLQTQGWGGGWRWGLKTHKRQKAARRSKSLLQNLWMKLIGPFLLSI